MRAELTASIQLNQFSWSGPQFSSHARTSANGRHIRRMSEALALLETVEWIVLLVVMCVVVLACGQNPFFYRPIGRIQPSSLRWLRLAGVTIKTINYNMASVYII